MPLHNVNPTTHDHVCVTCGAASSFRGHDSVKQVLTPSGVVLVVECENGHRECFNNALGPEEETSPTRDEYSREQVRNVRLLHKHLGLPVK